MTMYEVWLRAAILLKPGAPPTADPNYLPLSRLIPEHVLPIEWPLKPRLSDFWQITLAVERSLAAMEAHCRLCAAEINRGGFDILFANTCYFFHTSPIGRLATHTQHIILTRAMPMVV